MWTRSQIQAALTSRTAAAVVGSLTGFAFGVSGSYFFLAKRLERKYRAISDEEILQAKLFYSKRNKEGEFSDPSELAESLGLISENAPEEPEESEEELLSGAVEIMTRHDYTSYSKPAPQEEVIEVQHSIRKNIFDSQPREKKDYDEETEQAKRDVGEPYIITLAEYTNNEPRHSQVCLTYYEQDDVVANEIDIPMDDYERTLGEDNLKFGCGSHDPEIVYIRNDNLSEDFEIVLSRGSFAQEVAGFTDEDTRKKPRFRPED